jgi:DNA-binding MarR family transcriptional regulator
MPFGSRFTRDWSTAKLAVVRSRLRGRGFTIGEQHGSGNAACTADDITFVSRSLAQCLPHLPRLLRSRTIMPSNGAEIDMSITNSASAFRQPALRCVDSQRIRAPYEVEEQIARADCDGTHPPGFDLRFDVRIARRLRLLRKTMFGQDLYSGAGWEVLLYLFESHIFQRRDTIGNVTVSTGLPASTVQRWIVRLEDDRLIHVRDDHLDGRRRYVELSQSALELLNRYFSGAAPHPIAA